MDPTATLARIRELVTDVFACEDNPDPPHDLSELAIDLATQFDALDVWMKRGGFLPVQWRAPR